MRPGEFTLPVEVSFGVEGRVENNAFTSMAIVLKCFLDGHLMKRSLIQVM